MANLKKFEKNPQLQLLEQIKQARCVMLGTPNQDAHMQPMTPQVCLEDGAIYFYSDKTSHLGQSVAENPGPVHMCLIDDDYQACVKGYLITHDDPDTIKRFWNPIVAAWYPGGQTDPKMLMLKFVPHDASIWASDENVLTFAYAIAKANVTDSLPDIGEQKDINLRPDYAA